MIKDYFSLAFGNLKHRGLRSWLTMFGIFIGIAAVVSLISMGQGLQAAVTAQFGTLSLDTLTIQNKGTGFGPPGSTVVEKLNDRDVEIIENVQDVELIAKRLIRVGNLEYNDVSGFIYVADIPEEKNARDFIYKALDIKVQEGKLLESRDSGKVLLGNDFLENNNFEKDFEVGKKLKINGKDFEIIGILEKVSNFFANSAVLIINDDMEEVFETKGEYDIIVARVRDKDKLEEVSQEIARKLRSDRNEKIGEESFTIETPLQTLGSVNTILDIINLIVIGIATISLIVGGIGIANTMYTSVLERTKEIGIMKAIGARNKDILMIFLIEAGLLGLVGAGIGVLIGYGASKTIEQIAMTSLNTNLLQAAAPAYLVIGCLVFGFAIGAVSGVLPALRASKTNVVDALRYE